MMNFAIRLMMAFLVLGSRSLMAGGDEVVVVYNSRVPESKAVAEHYASLRQVPVRQVMGFSLTTNEVMTRADFVDFLQKPLAEQLEASGVWKFGEVVSRSTNGAVRTTDIRVVHSGIRYAVICQGVPLKIQPDSKVDEFAGKIINENLRHNEAAVDSELAWLPMLRMKIPLTGPLPNPFYLCTNRASLNCTNGILLVSRLDGPTPEIAKSLVDKALTAEKCGLWGRAYLDARGLSTNSIYYLGDHWILNASEVCRQLGFETETDRVEATLPATLPMSHIAIYAGWYSGDVCGPFTQSKMEFMPGAFAYHLHSFSAETIRSSLKNWCGPLLSKGATCTMGSVYEPYLQFTPDIGFFLEAMGRGFTYGEAAWASQNALSWQTTVIGDPLYQPFSRSPSELLAHLARQHDPLIEWAFERLACLDLARGAREPQVIHFLENLPATPKSSVLNEKIAELYGATGKPAESVQALKKALRLAPSPQQNLRLRLALGKQLCDLGFKDEAVGNFKALIKECPDYPGLSGIVDRLKSLDQKAPAPSSP